jgi:peptidoglycan DL-endopeptidase CwlO
MTRTRKRAARLLAAALFVVPLLLGSLGSSQAAPSKQDIAAAKAKLNALYKEFDALAEQINTTQVKLDEAQGRLNDARATRDQAIAEATDARSQLADRAVAAYEGAGSQIDVLLQADNFGDFNDRLQYMGALAQSDADLAAKADSAGQRAQWAAQQFASIAAEKQQLLDQLKRQQDAFQAKIADQKGRVADLQKEFDQWRAAQIAAARAAARAAAQATVTTIPQGNPPPINGSGASAAIAAAESQIGVPYVWGTMNPGVSFDCSGLTAWAWGQAGVYLPHSSAMQAATTPDVARADLQPGDLVFFYSPISHVGLYIGGGFMIDASHSGPGGEVAKRPVYDNFTVGGRVG